MGDLHVWSCIKSSMSRLLVTILDVTVGVVRRWSTPVVGRWGGWLTGDPQSVTYTNITGILVTDVGVLES